MENGIAEETTKSCSRQNSTKDLSSSRGSIRSLEKRVSNTGSIKSEKSNKSEKDVQFASSVKDRPLQPLDPSMKVPHKFITNWKQACDRTKDKTRDLLKRWRTLPESDERNDGMETPKSHSEKCGWSVHVWTTWVDRYSVDNSDSLDAAPQYNLTPTQSSKFSHFFTYLLDHDNDDLVSDQDFQAFAERLRHFADWSTNSSEFIILQQVERGFTDTFLCGIADDRLGFQVNNQIYITREGWLQRWAELISTSKNLNDFPVWLQYLIKILFQVINRSGSGIISRDELSAFYSSVLGFDSTKVTEIIDVAYKAMTSNGDHPLSYRAYRLCFANYLLAKHPNGSGQFLLGFTPSGKATALFPVDYSALNTQPEDLEQYTPDHTSNRHSVIV